MSCVGPCRRRKSDKVVTEIDKGLYVLPVVEVVVLYAAENTIQLIEKREVSRNLFIPSSLNKLIMDVATHHVMADDHFL